MYDRNAPGTLRKTDSYISVCLPRSSVMYCSAFIRKDEEMTQALSIGMFVSGQSKETLIKQLLKGKEIVAGEFTHILCLLVIHHFQTQVSCLLGSAIVTCQYLAKLYSHMQLYILFYFRSQSFLMTWSHVSFDLSYGFLLST